MKVSELIAEIIVEAEAKYGISNHNNDGIHVGIFYAADTWQVWISRPTQNQLDRGEVPTSDINTVKVSEEEVRFMSKDTNLVRALLQLREAVELEEWDE